MDYMTVYVSGLFQPKIGIPCIIWLLQALTISSCYTDMVLDTCSTSFNVLVLKLPKKPLFFILNIFLVNWQKYGMKGKDEVHFEVLFNAKCRKI